MNQDGQANMEMMIVVSGFSWQRPPAVPVAEKELRGVPARVSATSAPKCLRKICDLRKLGRSWKPRAFRAEDDGLRSGESPSPQAQ